MRVAPFALALLLLAGCGTDRGGDVVTEQPLRGSDDSAEGSTELTVVVNLHDGQGKRTFSLTCDPSGGDHPRPEAACRLLEELEEPLAALPPRTACTEIYGGPQTATVTGTLRGERVAAEFSRTDGCQVDRWDAHAALLGDAGAGV